MTARPPTRGHHASKGSHEGEAYISAEYPSSRTHARVSRSHEHEKRPAGAQAPPCEGPQAVDRQQRIGLNRVAGFSRDERIRRRVEYQKIYDRGARVHGRLLTLFALPNQLPYGRLGIAASRKLGGAVQRNRAKRLIREVFRRNKPAPGFDIVVVPKRELLDASLTALEIEFRQVLSRSLRRAGAAPSV